jgi:hypothetical protein
MFNKLIKIVGLQSEEERRAELRRNLIRHEAQIGGELFGPVPAGTVREFFCLDQYTWIWYEEWTDDGGTRQKRTTRYDIRSDDIVKTTDGEHYQNVSDKEIDRLIDAVTAYRDRVRKEIYHPVVAS